MSEQQFLVWSPDVAFPPHVKDSESSAAKLAESLAREYQGRRFWVAGVIASVIIPLPPAQWSDGRVEAQDTCNEVAMGQIPQCDAPLGANKALAPERLMGGSTRRY